MLAKSWKLTTAALLLAVGGLSAHASLVTTTLNHVVIGGTAYDVTFTQDSDGITSFNDVFGTGSAPLTFTTATSASDAAWAVLAAGEAVNFDFTPAEASNGFVLAFGDSASTFNYYTAFADPPPFSNGVFGPFSNPRTMGMYLSVASFSESATTVPEPASLALTGVALAGLAAIRRRVGR